jgi:hypothetical protein
MFNTDRDIVKGHITFKFKEDEEVPAWTSHGGNVRNGGDGADQGRTPTPKRCRAHCSKEGAVRKSSSHSHNSGACMQGATVGWMLGSSDKSC